jgi:hypothetical protein
MWRTGAIRKTGFLREAAFIAAASAARGCTPVRGRSMGSSWAGSCRLTRPRGIESKPSRHASTSSAALGSGGGSIGAGGRCEATR